MGELLADCENLSKNAGECAREQTRQRGDEQIRIESGEHSRQARRRMSWEREPDVTRAEGLVGCAAGRNDDVVERWGNGFCDGAQDSSFSERMCAPCFSEM